MSSRKGSCKASNKYDNEGPLFFCLLQRSSITGSCINQFGSFFRIQSNPTGSRKHQSNHALAQQIQAQEATNSIAICSQPADCALRTTGRQDAALAFFESINLEFCGGL
jgi:hypothetical protein